MRYKLRRTYTWTPELAYCTGLLATDGCLSGDLRHIDFTSKDFELVALYRELIKPGAKIGTKPNGHGGTAYRVQISDVSLYEFLLNVGLTPRKSNTLGALNIPDIHYADFLRGCFDGDGTTFSYWDKRWKASFMYYSSFASASPLFLEWLQQKNSNLGRLGKGYIRAATAKSRVGCLTYAKQDTRSLYALMYYKPGLPCLSRKLHSLQAAFAQTTPM